MIETTPRPEGAPPPERLLRLGDVVERLGIGKSTLYRMMAAGTFPRPLEITPGWKAWREAEVDAWIVAAASAATPTAH